MKLLLQNIKALLPEDGTLAVRECSVGVEGDKIAFVGQTPPGFAPDKTILGEGRLVIPGLVNAHTHAYMTIFRNRADDLPFNQWLFENILPMEDRLQSGDSYWGALLAACEMLRGGTTCYNDMYISTDENARAAVESGMRAVLSRGLVGESRSDPGGVDRLRQASDEIKAYRGAGDGRISFCLAPHAPYTCAPAYLEWIAETARELDVGIHIHLGESRAEIAGLQEKYGKTPFALVESTGLLALPTVAAHCVYMTQEDIAIAARTGMCVATNPVSNLKLANGFAPVPQLLAAGVNVALGTDGAASNNALNMFRELNFLCLLHKGNQEDAQSVTAAQGLHIATLGGAAALGLGEQTGSIEPGKKADLAILNIRQSHWYPHSNLLAALCYGAQGSEVETVLVDGEILLEDGAFTRLDEERIRYEVQRISDRICKH
ncbi:MAG: amidohydrolase [Oscillospiraceae bacterium]|jgi:5-methylthioadenosine/S-adenosylhomocysteine deaminase|nr:amidohydrolase [Oscillospiraceae bacterium]